MIKSFFRRPTRIFNLTTAADPDSVAYGDDPNSVFDDGTVVKAWVAPFKSPEEFLVDRDTRLSVFDVRYPVNTPVVATSEIEFEGRLHRVVGRPRVFYRKRKADHIHLIMEAVEG